MPGREKAYAQQLYRELVKKYANGRELASRILNTIKSKGVTIRIKGVGVHWSCTVTKEGRSCKITCFNIDRADITYKGPEYYTSFETNGQNQAYGRTFEREETLSAVEEWINGNTLEHLYFQFNFIDRSKRYLERAQEIIINHHPELGDLPQNGIKEGSFSSYSLYFNGKNRGCRIYTYEYEPHPRCVFSWDGAGLLEVAGTDLNRISDLIKRWVCDNAMPSILKQEFDEIRFGFLASYYEAGNGMDGEFIMSWDEIEEFYSESDLKEKEQILHMILAMREKGFDKTLRAGQSLYTLVLSRARKHGLTADQPAISFSFQYIRSKMEVYSRRSGEKIPFDQITYNETIHTMLKELEQEPIT